MKKYISLIISILGCVPLLMGQLENATTLTVESELAVYCSGTFNNNNGGTVQGGGTIDVNTFSCSSGSTINPGSSPGRLTFNTNADLTSSDVNIEIDGTTAATEYDQIMVNGTVNLTSSTLNVSGSHTPVSGNSFTIINNDGADAISGTFNGLPEGGTVTLNSATLYISYQGGDGNDVVLSFSSPLPVELVGFSAKADKANTLLHWTTASESGNEGFVIEHSMDGISWYYLDLVAGQGYSIEKQDYSYAHQDPDKGTNYYRLKQLDFDGSFEYSKIVSVFFNGDRTPMPLIYPNPVHAGSLTLYLPEMGEVPALLTLFDRMGRKVINQTIYSAETNLELHFLPKGPYVAIVDFGNNRISQKVMVD